MKTYRLKRDLPIGRAGTIWHTNNTCLARAYMSCDGEGISILRELIPDWWEEIVDMKPFTKEQRNAILARSVKLMEHIQQHKEIEYKDSFVSWLDENTEQV